MKTIQEMASEAGLCTWTVPPQNVVETWEAFAALVREEAQRKPLSDEEIHKVAFNIDGKTPNAHIKFARAIEAAHGIKGDA